MSTSLLNDRRRIWAAQTLRLKTGSDEKGYSLSPAIDLRCEEYQLILVCPSTLKECGIGRYTNHVAQASVSNFHTVSIFQSTYQALNYLISNPRKAVVIFEHEYSLVDFQFDLGEDDTTSSVITNFSLIQALDSDHRTCVFMHALLLLDFGLNRINRQWHSAQIPLFHTSREGCALAQLNFTDLGIPSFGFSQPPAPPSTFTVGAFGFLSPNKDVSSTLRLCAATGARIRANYAPSNTASEADIRTERQKVEALFSELNLTGEITFDFLEDQELVEMLEDVSVVYAPQHDFAHYSTSASVRFPLAVGRGVLVPPHRCFHDVSAGVKFADFDTAVATVRSMMQRPLEAKELGDAGFAFAAANEIGSVYKRLAGRLITDQAWCGGDAQGLRLPDTVNKVNNKISSLGDETYWSTQNGRGRVNTGRGLVGGFFSYDHASVPPERTLEDVITTKSAECEEAFRQGRAAEWIEEQLSEKEVAASHLRAVCGGNPNRVSLVEIESMPSYLQVLCLTLKLNLAANGASEILSALGVGQERFKHLGALFRLAEKLTAYSDMNVAETEDLIWGHALAPHVDHMRELIYPATLLTLQPIVFVKSAYRLLLRRDPDDAGLAHHHRLLASGLKQSDVAFSMINTVEGRRVGIKLAGTHREWSDYEAEAQGLAEMSKLIAPFMGLLKTENLELRDRAYAGLLR